MSSENQTVDIAMVEANLEQPFFTEAIEAIQASVLEEHRQNFHHQANASLLLDELRSLATSRDARSSLCARKLALFICTFAPYFDVLSTCVQLRLEWVGWLWGTVRLVFRASTDYPLFLEKIADMFEAIAHTLPPYQQIFEICKRSASNSEPRSEDIRLGTLMSYVYADLVYFSLDLYHILCREPQGPALRHLAFDSVQPTLWRPLDSRFSRLETRITHHRRWLQKETESPVQNYSDVAQHRKDYLDFLYRQGELNGNTTSELETQRAAKRLRRVKKVQNWISNQSLPVNVCDCGTRKQDRASCVWFLKLQAYRNWKDESFDRNRANDTTALEATWQHRVLFVQGTFVRPAPEILIDLTEETAKLGFGKTYISDAVIDHLNAEAENIEICERTPSTAFYQFAHNNPESNHPDDAFRALTYQLLQTHRHNRLALDAMCLLLRRTSNREKATANEVLDVLSLLLRQHPTFLVIDGIDDCSSIETFLSSLAGLCRKSDTKVIIFSRPNIRIPLEYQKWASDAPHILSLTPEHNAGVMQQHVAGELNRMADQGYFGISMDRTLIPQVAQASNGEFLWASGLLKFLQSSTLSSDERYAILQNMQSFAGLEPLYRNIFTALKRRSEYEKCVITDVFRWLSHPIHRLDPSALQGALSSHSISPEESSLTDLMVSLPELTHGMLQVSNNTISFAHGSIGEYLQAPISQDSEFSLHNESSVHAHLAARCLAYLAYNVPKRPLGGLRPYSSPTIPTSSGASLRTSKSGDSGYKSVSSSDGDNDAAHPPIHNHHSNASQTSIRTIPFDTHLPFLRYAALCWPIHLSRALSETHLHHLHSPTSTLLPFLPALGAFLNSRLAVTVWVEASFRYSLPPTLTRLVGPLSDLKGEVSPATVEGRDLRLVLKELRELSDRLVDLKRECATELRNNPSLIWQLDSADGEEYWPVWDGGVTGN